MPQKGRETKRVEDRTTYYGTITVGNMIQTLFIIALRLLEATAEERTPAVQSNTGNNDVSILYGKTSYHRPTNKLEFRSLRESQTRQHAYDMRYELRVEPKWG